jgi:hypothetical protein
MLEKRGVGMGTCTGLYWLKTKSFNGLHLVLHESSGLLIECVTAKFEGEITTRRLVIFSVYNEICIPDSGMQINVNYRTCPNIKQLRI